MTLWRYMEKNLQINCHECDGLISETDHNSGVFWCDNCDAERHPYITVHAQKERWVPYTDDSVGNDIGAVLDAWQRGRPVVEDPRDWSEKEPGDLDITEYIGHRYVGSQLRYDDVTRCGLLLRNNKIVTVIEVPTARLNTKMSVAQTYVADGESSESIAGVIDDIDLRDAHIAGGTVSDALVERERLRRAFEAKYRQQQAQSSNDDGVVIVGSTA